MPETRWGVSAPDFAVGACAQGVNSAVSRRAGPSSARNERTRLGEPVLLVFYCGITGRVRERTVRTLILTNSNTSCDSNCFRNSVVRWVGCKDIFLVPDTRAICIY